MNQKTIPTSQRWKKKTNKTNNINDYQKYLNIPIKDLIPMNHLNNEFWYQWYQHNIHQPPDMDIKPYIEYKLISMFVSNLINLTVMKEAEKIINGKHYNFLNYLINYDLYYNTKLNNTVIINLMSAAISNQDKTSIYILTPLLLNYFIKVDQSNTNDISLKSSINSNYQDC